MAKPSETQFTGGAHPGLDAILRRPCPGLVNDRETWDLEVLVSPARRICEMRMAAN